VQARLVLCGYLPSGILSGGFPRSKGENDKFRAKRP
jgi:hypothetical protein